MTQTVWVYDADRSGLHGVVAKLGSVGVFSERAQCHEDKLQINSESLVMDNTETPVHEEH